MRKLISALQDKSGASVIFVLAVMVFLMAIGVSVLVAATTTGMNSPIQQKEHDILLLMQDSVHRNIMYSLQADPTDLSAQIVKLIYDEREDINELEIPITAKLDNGNHLDRTDVAFSFRNVNVAITDAVPAVLTLIPDEWAYDDFNYPYVLTWKLSFEEEDNGYGKSDPRLPQTATVNAEMVVAVTVTNENGFVMSSEAVYRFTGGKFSDDPDGTLHYDNDDADFVGDMLFTDDGYGEWEMIGYAITENIN
jgi:hypothetical protein